MLLNTKSLYLYKGNKMNKDCNDDILNIMD